MTVPGGGPASLLLLLLLPPLLPLLPLLVLLLLLALPAARGTSSKAVILMRPPIRSSLCATAAKAATTAGSLQKQSGGWGKPRSRHSIAPEVPAGGSGAALHCTPVKVRCRQGKLTSPQGRATSRRRSSPPPPAAATAAAGAVGIQQCSRAVEAPNPAVLARRRRRKASARGRSGDPAARLRAAFGQLNSASGDIGGFIRKQERGVAASAGELKGGPLCAAGPD